MNVSSRKGSEGGRQAASRPLWSTGGGHLILFFSMLLTFYLVEPPERTLAWNELFNFGHILLFAAAFVLILGWLERIAPHWTDMRREMVTVAVTCALAVATEASQIPLETRVASVADIARDAAGALAAFGFTTHYRWQERRGRLCGLTVLGAAALVTVLAMVQPLATACTYRYRNRLFPVLARWDGAWWESRLIAARDAELRPSPWGIQQGRLESWAELVLQPAPYPGVSLLEPYPDWEGFTRLVFDVDATDSDSLTLGVHIHDRAYRGRDDQRFNKNFVLGPGRHRVEIPFSDLHWVPSGRPLELTAIRGVRIYAMAIVRPRTVRLSEVRLER